MSGLTMLRRSSCLAVLCAVACFVALSPSLATAATLTRPADPVVLKGADVPSLAAAGIAPDDLVAFRYEAGWVQIPVQVDERDAVDFGQIYGDPAVNPTAENFGVGYYDEFYTDPDTFTGPDSDPSLDPTDEIVFMAADAGDQPPAFSEPAGVVADSGVEVRIDDGLDGGLGYIYLFQQDGSLEPGAGEAYVTYTFNLLSGDYKTTYLFGGNGTDHGPLTNEEDSTIATDHYQAHFSWRWTWDDLHMLDGTGDDILERRDYWVAPGSCSRNNCSFNSGEGCFIVNKSGPVRAIRCYMGANSGPLMQQDHVFYRQRQDLTVTGRVHARGSTGMFYFDYNEDAFGMTYSNEYNTGGVTIDGVPDSPSTDYPNWEMVTGVQGTMTILHDVVTDIPIGPVDFRSFYEDDLNTIIPQCQACTDCAEVDIVNDPYMIGASGPWITAPLPNVDPRLGEYNNLALLDVCYFDAPGLTTTDAEQRRAWVSNPLQTTISFWGPGPAGGNTPPAFAFDPVDKPNAAVAEQYSGSIAGAATDDDGDLLTYHKVSGPSWLHITPAGDLLGSPGVATSGLSSWGIMVIDGNGGSDTATLNITVGGEPEQELNGSLTDDAFTEGTTTDNFGSEIGVALRAGERIGWLKFDVTDVPDGAVISSATLQLRSLPSVYVPEETTVHRCDDTTWTELTTTGANKPTVGAALDTVTGIAGDSWYDFDVTPAVTGNGEVAFALTDTNTETNDRGWWAKEKGTNYAARLVITYGGGGNSSPSFSSTTIVLANATSGVDYAETIAGTATDGDGDPLTYERSCCGGGEWLEVAPDGSLSGIPRPGDIGTDAYTVVVRDPSGDQDFATLIITVDPGDYDGDGLGDEVEGVIGTDPENADSDGDGMSDYDEVNWDGGWTGDPADFDPYDPVTNPTGTDLNPNDTDTDDDGVEDGQEVVLGTDPLDDGDTPGVPAAGIWSLICGAASLILLGWLALRGRRVRNARRQEP